MVMSVPRPFASMLPPSETNVWPLTVASNIRIPSARATRAGTWQSLRQFGYFAQPVNPNRAMATSARGASRLTKIGPKSRAQPRSVGKRKNSTRVRFTPILFRIWRALSSCAFELTKILTISPPTIWRTISPYTQGMGANFPGQSVRLCGHPIQVASCGSHSAGKR